MTRDGGPQHTAAAANELDAGGNSGEAIGDGGPQDAAAADELDAGGPSHDVTRDGGTQDPAAAKLSLLSQLPHTRWTEEWLGDRLEAKPCVLSGYCRCAASPNPP